MWSGSSYGMRKLPYENEAGIQVQLPFLEDQLFYGESTQVFEIFPGETYTLNVFADGATYTAQCTVPENTIEEIKERILVTPNDFGFNEYDLELSFTDIEQQDNFYYVGAFIEVQEEDDTLFNNFRPIPFEQAAFQTDNLRDGLEIGASAQFFPALNFDENGETFFLEQDLVLQVMNAERPLYQLLRANYLNEINEGDPFIELSVEPNVIEGKGGTGLFASYRYFEKRIALEEQ